MPTRAPKPEIPEAIRDYFRQEGKRGGRAAAANMTPAERTARARKGAQAKARKARQAKKGARP